MPRFRSGLSHAPSRPLIAPPRLVTSGSGSQLYPGLQALVPSHTLTNVVYQSNLVEQETCGQCCEGYHVCGVSDVCRPISTREASYCVPSNATTHDYCGVPVLMKQKTFCESCTEASPAAEAFEAQFNVAPEISSSRRRLLSTSWAATPSNAPSCSKDVPCKVSEACCCEPISCKPDVSPRSKVVSLLMYGMHCSLGRRASGAHATRNLASARTIGIARYAANMLPLSAQLAVCMC